MVSVQVWVLFFSFAGEGGRGCWFFRVFSFPEEDLSPLPFFKCGQKGGKIETHTVMCLCDKKRRAQTESQRGEKKSKKTENKTKKFRGN